MQHYHMQNKPRGNYRYFCTKCGAPHRHRNCNKYPDLCESCAKRQAQLDRHAANENGAALNRLFQTVGMDLAKVSGRLEIHT